MDRQRDRFRTRITKVCAAAGMPSCNQDVWLSCGTGSGYNRSGNVAERNDESYVAVISGDGRFVLVHSYASNLVPRDHNKYGTLFLRDRRTGTTERVPNGAGFGFSISSTGRFIAFRASLRQECRCVRPSETHHGARECEQSREGGEQKELGLRD
jgi:hypothetical protein